MRKILLINCVLIFLVFFFISCSKNNIEIHGRLVHANGKPDIGTNLNLSTDLLSKKHARYIASGRSDSDGYFIIYARARPNGNYYLYAVGGNGENILLMDGKSFSATKNIVTDVGEITVSW